MTTIAKWCIVYSIFSFKFCVGSREVLLPMLVRQLKSNMSKFEELQICADILNEMLSRFNRVEMVRYQL